METALPLHFKLYLEGVPVDFESASIDSQIGRPSLAQITIPPTVLSQKILPRTSVHLFYMDPDETYTEAAGEELKGKPVYKLLFEGEVVALNYNKSPTSRSTTLVCSDLTNNFHYAHKFVIEDASAFAGAPCQEAYSGTKAAVGLTDSPAIGGPISRFISGQNTISEGVKGLIRAVFTGSNDITDNSSNAFLLSVEERYKISKRVQALEDEDVKKLAEVKSLEKIIARAIGRSPPNLSLTDMINMFLSFIYYNRISMIAPSYTDSTINSLLLLPNIYFSPPPKCNVLFPEHVGNIGYTDNFLKTPTRLFMQTATFGTSNRGDQYTQCVSTYLAPRELSALLPTGGAGLSKKDSDLQRKLTSEEHLKGIIPVFKTLGQSEYVTELGARRDKDGKIMGKAADSIRNYVLNMAEYELEIRRAETRSVDSITGPFNPETVVGAPVSVLDEVLYIFGILQHVRHVIHASSGASTMYSIALARRVSTDFEDLYLPDDASEAAFDAVDRIIQANKLKDADQRESSTLEDLKAPLDVLVASDADERLIDIIRRLVDSPIDERESIIDQYELLVNEGIFENLPETPRWINSKFTKENASESYQKLYGTESMLDISSESQLYNSSSLSASKIMNEYNMNVDKYSFTKRFTKRKNITTQKDFNDFYELPYLSDESQEYPATGPFTKSRRKAIIRYVNDLRRSKAHAG